MHTGIIFFEDGSVQFIGSLNSIRLIALKVQEVIPQLIQQERDSILSSMTEEEIKRAAERYGEIQNEKT